MKRTKKNTASPTVDLVALADIVERFPSRTILLLGDFVADAWPFYLGTFAALIVVMIATSYVAFRRLPDVNRKLSYEVDAKGILTKDAADFALMVP